MIIVKTTKEIFAANKFKSWLKGGKNDEHSAIHRLRQGFVNIDTPSTFGDINNSCFAIGSCFAREIEDELESRNISCLSKSSIVQCINDSPDLFKVKNVGGRPYAFLNRYSPASLKTFFDFIQNKSLGNSLLVPSKENSSLYDDLLFTRLFEPLKLDLCIRRREKIKKAMKSALQNSSRLIITLGLIEYYSIQSKGDIIAANIPPSLNSSSFSDFAFSLETTSTTISNIKHIIKSARHLNNNIEVILTVSPVPLDATFRDMDIIIANNFSKSVLVSAVHELMLNEANNYCHYFPSYEIVINSEKQKAWREDLRHVQPEMVEFILKKFAGSDK